MNAKTADVILANGMCKLSQAILHSVLFIEYAMDQLSIGRSQSCFKILIWLWFYTIFSTHEIITFVRYKAAMKLLHEIEIIIFIG